MSFLKRLFAAAPDPREEVRALWSAVVAEARMPAWYRDRGVADTLEGRFDMVTTVLALTLLRMERTPALAVLTAPLAEIFVEEMDGQLRQTGVGDLMVGKQIGRLMSVLGGRVGALREALGGEDLDAVLARNMTLADAAQVPHLASGVRDLAARLDRTSDEALLQGRLA